MANTILHKKAAPCLLQSLKTSQRFLCFLRFQLPLVDADVSSKSMLMIK
jgi:hypothetical protein